MTRLHALLLFLAFAVSTTANAQSTPVVSVVPVVARAHQDEMGVRQRAQFVQLRCFGKDLDEVNSRTNKEWAAPHLEFKQMVNNICKNPDKKRAASSPVLATASARGVEEEDSFDNVAAGSLSVRSKGRDYNLRKIGGNTRACHPPRELVRSDRCRPTPDGRGVRCQFDCK